MHRDKETSKNNLKLNGERNFILSASLIMNSDNEI